MKKKDIIKDILRIFNSYIFLGAYFLDSYLEFKTYSTSKFAKYKLKYTIVDSIGSFFNRNQKEDRPTNAFLDSMIQDVSKSNIKSMIDDEEEDDDDSLLMPVNTNDIELVLIYRNNIFIEDYFFYYYDYIMNVTLSGLYLIYKKKEFSPTYANTKQLNKEMNITESTIFGGEKYSNTYTSNTFKKLDVDDDDNLTYKTNSCSTKDEYVFIKDSSRNDFDNSEKIFTKTLNDYSYDNLTIKITPYFTSKCVSNLIEKNFTTKIITDSLKSHLNNDNNNDSK